MPPLSEGVLQPIVAEFRVEAIFTKFSGTVGGIAATKISEGPDIEPQSTPLKARTL